MRKPKILIIVESPAKINTIKKYLPDDNSYIMLASIGHIADLSDRYKFNLGVDIENEFKPHYILNKDKIDVLNAIINATSISDKVLLAMDNDREGECIAYLISQRLTTSSTPIKRITFNEISQKGVLTALKNERDIDQNLASAAISRRVLDKIVGYMASPFVIKNLGAGFSAGRVQSVALKLVVEREYEIEKFIPKEYWNVKVNVGKDSTQCFLASLNVKEINTKEEAAILKEELENSIIIVSGIEARPKERTPPEPLITSSLLMLASSKYKISVSRTMEIAQELYESGYITYMRTDSKRLSDEAIDNIRSYISEKYPKYLPKTKNVYKNNDAAQDAHEAIRPTHMEKLPANTLDTEQSKIYKIIWDITVASQMTPAKYNTTTIKLVTNKRKELKANGKVLVSPGWLAVTKNADIEEVDDSDNLLPILKKGEKLTIYKPGVVNEQKFTQPPSRYKEATLVDELKKKGIGRPATYASIMKKICETRAFVKKTKEVLYPTDQGKDVVCLLDKHFTFMKYDYTSLMEDKLELIAQGKCTYLETMTEFFIDFNNELVLAYNKQINEKIAIRKLKELTKKIEANEKITLRNIEVVDRKLNQEPENTVDPKNTGFFCELCRYPMMLRFSSLGYFLGCSNFPHCRNVVQCKIIDNVITPTKDEKVLAPENIHCPSCNGVMVISTGKFGSFYCCKTFPICKGKRKIPCGKKCPECNGDLHKTIFENPPFCGSVLCCMEYPKCRYIEKFEDEECKLSEGDDI